mmetsp:Transcript_1799/g.11020  ORF Transcript_1799/g.11020 Transcript_1799/m.11020 type:complete len:224 (-) Transcript_1799:60-731(-)
MDQLKGRGIKPATVLLLLAFRRFLTLLLRSIAILVLGTFAVVVVVVILLSRKVFILIFLVVGIIPLGLSSVPQHRLGYKFVSYDRSHFIIFFQSSLQLFRFFFVQFVGSIWYLRRGKEIEEALAGLGLLHRLCVGSSTLGFFLVGFHGETLVGLPQDFCPFQPFHHGLFVIGHAIGFGKHGVFEVRIFSEVEIEAEPVFFPFQHVAGHVFEIRQRFLILLFDL